MAEQAELAGIHFPARAGLGLEWVGNLLFLVSVVYVGDASRSAPSHWLLHGSIIELSTQDRRGSDSICNN